MNLLRRMLRYVPTLILSIILAVAVWISAVTSNDPTEERTYPRTVPIETVGLDPAMILTSGEPRQLSLRLSAPRSVWDQLGTDRAPVRALVDLAGLQPGTHTLDVQVQVGITPVRVVSSSPQTLTLTLEKLSTTTLPIQVVRRGEPAVGYEAGQPKANMEVATVSGPQSLVERVKKLRVVLDITRANDTLNRSLPVQALDENDLQISGVTLTPDQISVSQPITQRGGYRNVVVKVVTTGQISGGYRLITISVFPPAVTVFASDPTLVDKLPGYVETSPVDLTGAKTNVDMRVSLNLPEGISVVGDQTVNVVVGVSAIEGSLTLSEVPVQVINLSPELGARLSPETVNIILSGPLPVLDTLKSTDIRVVIDLIGVTAGTYQLVPRVELQGTELRVESVLPGSIEVVVGKLTPTPGPPSH
jgi:YbbR domain-containing protein